MRSWKMLHRLFAFAFIVFTLGAPLAGIASFVGGSKFSAAETQQKSMCLTTGVGCGAGHILLPAVGRM